MPSLDPPKLLRTEVRGNFNIHGTSKFSHVNSQYSIKGMGIGPPKGTGDLQCDTFLIFDGKQYPLDDQITW